MKYLYLVALCATGTLSCVEKPAALVTARQQYTREKLLSLRKGADDRSPKAAMAVKEFASRNGLTPKTRRPESDLNKNT